ncbi:MAG: hypothetical protein NUV55_06195 [Sulfuricaulis sp.]|uniref:SGNH/GDSL hydrolase family protein n=1 Tax=Sulfuricaulis sp. TaxID=2003553 RepID=UPI0025D7DF7F|nr:hypothetical protein [Sulfuricaulis sp.]MCR4346775.1 hypothetical protein [Sulfuricaulis sp.]
MLVDFSLEILGPHDLLGFRNMNIPNVADVVTIGDSQTYGNNVGIAENWPSQLERLLKVKRSVVYSMASGGWGAVQYLNMYTHATFFRPRVIVIAFYSGNDPDESVTLAYSVEHWAPLRPDPSLDLSDKPRYPGFPVPLTEQWRAHFKDGQTITFTPSLRLVSNDTAHATVRAGYQIMEKVAQLIARSASEAGIHIVLTIIPTKELVYAQRVHREGITASADYKKLVELERENINRLAQSFKLLPNAVYVDLVEPLQKAAFSYPGLYPSQTNGHPMENGYRLIASVLAPAIGKYVKEPPLGLVRVVPDDKSAYYFLVADGGLWRFATDKIAASNGWKPANARTVDARDIAVFPQFGMIDIGDPKRFGPQRVRQRYAAQKLTVTNNE